MVQAKSFTGTQRLIDRTNLTESALGMVSTRSFPAIVDTADMMLKSAKVLLVGYEKTGSGFCTAVVRGRIADVRIAVESGAEAARQSEQLVSSLVIPRPLPNLETVLPIGSQLMQLAHEGRRSKLSNQAIGLIETRGFPAMVGAADKMLKSADVQMSAYETIGAGLCTAIIRGRVADVAVAIQAGMYEAQRIGELNAIAVIARPLDDLEQTLPTASCWLEQPLQLPVALKANQAQLVELPELQLAQPEFIELPDLKK